MKYDLATLRESVHLPQMDLAKKLGVCVAKCRQMERANDPRVLTAIIESIDSPFNPRTVTLREAYDWAKKEARKA
jgi:hypothetical protein